MKLARFAPLLGLFVSTVASAGDSLSHFDFTFFGTNAGSYTMVSCDYAQDLAGAWLTKFGATDVDLYCTGGIQPTGLISPLTIRATYRGPDLTRAVRKVAMKFESGAFDGDSNCFFDTSLMRSMLVEFPNVTANRKQDGCFEPRSRYRYELIATLPN
ncbi:MAG: hypothetical protein JST04_16275 [Bdellovibrionales bacterium]|nr:hypothetical protein [Bdellovibrionales bacterium]